MNVRTRRRLSAVCRSRGVVLPAALLALAALVASPVPRVMAQSMDANLWVTDGNVHTIVPWGNTLYVGGTFAYVGPNTGGWVEVYDNGRATPLLPRLDGDVTAMVSDGADGWFIGGTFTHVAGIARPGLAHVLANGSLAAWTPSPLPSGTVACLAHSTSRLFVSTQSAQLLAYDDASGSQVVGWAPNVTGPVVSMAVSGSTLFIAGDMSFQIASPPQTGYGLAAIGAATGVIENWDPAPDAPVDRIQIEGRWLYVSGGFSQIGGQSHAGLARALHATRSFDADWAPSVDGPIRAMAVVADRLWIGGEFYFVDGEFRDRLADVDTTLGGTIGATPSLAAYDGAVTAMLVRGQTTYLGLAPVLVYNDIGAAKPIVLRTSGGAIDNQWSVLGEGSPTTDAARVSGLALTPTGILATGHFVSAGGIRQVGVVALDRATGVPRPWDPRLATDDPFPFVPDVTAILPTDHAIYLGGSFNRAGGQLRRSLAAIDPVTGRAQAWQADLSTGGRAYALALYQDKLLVGGTFTTLSGVSHSGLALVDTVVGTPVAGWTCDVTGTVNCLLVQGGTVFVGGALSSLGGQSRANLGAVNASTAAVLSGWNPGALGNKVLALVSRGDSLYIGGDYSMVGGQTRICLAAVSASSGTLLGWNPGAFGPVQGLAVDGPNILVGGEFQTIAGQPAGYLARLGRFTGTQVAGLAGADLEVLAIAGDAGSLYVGGKFGQLAQSPTAHLGRASQLEALGPSVSVILANGGEQLVTGTRYRFEYTAADPSGVASVDLELSRSGLGGPWTLLAAGLRNTGRFEWLVTDPSVNANAWLRVTARDFAGNSANDRSDAAFSIGTAVASVGPPAAGAALAAFAVGPNPARSGIDLRFALRQSARTSFRLLDVQGREVRASPETEYVAGEHVLPCELRGIAPGLYFVRFESGRESRTARLVVIR